MAAEHVHGGVLHELLDERADGVVVAVGLVGLDHGEFRRVGGVDALVAEVAVDFEHAVDAADEATLQGQFRRDAQVEVKVEGVHVRGERTSRGTAVHGLQHRGFDLEEVMVAQEATALERLRTMLRIFSSAIMPMYGLRVRVSSLSSLCRAGSGCNALAALAHSVANTDSSPVLEAITRPLMNRWSPRSTSC